VLALEAEEVTDLGAARCQVYGVPMGAAALDRLVVLAGELRARGVSTDLAYGGRGLKGAMKGADRSGARFALVLGDRELDAGQIEVKDLADGSQRTVALDAVVADVATTLHG